MIRRKNFCKVFTFSICKISKVYDICYIVEIIWPVPLRIRRCEPQKVDLALKSPKAASLRSRLLKYSRNLAFQILNLFYLAIPLWDIIKNAACIRSSEYSAIGKDLTSLWTRVANPQRAFPIRFLVNIK